jgi:hypothetical protein
MSTKALVHGISMLIFRVAPCISRPAILNPMQCIPLIAALWMAAAASAQDTQLSVLHATLVTLRLHAAQTTIETSGARPELTIAKHQLRDWVEMQLGSLKDFEGAKALSDRINKGLKAVGVAEIGDDQNLLGTLGDVVFSSESGLLIVTTAVGILCQYDESAYAYKLVCGRWQRVWESEQNDYSPAKYTPQHIVAVHVWQSFKDGHGDGPPFVLTLGNHWGCASAWHPVYYRVWRVDPSGSKLLIDDSAMAWLRTETYAVGSITQDRTNENAPVDVLIEFTGGSIDATVGNREVIRHYLIAGDQVRRVDPVALSPRDFVDEWLTRDWNESTTWSASSMLRQWHRKLHADRVGGEFSDATMHCQTPDLWQVSFEHYSAQKNLEPEPDVYFLVRWRPPYHFTIMDVRDKPWPRCTQEDREADEWRTLFSTQEWRR